MSNNHLIVIIGAGMAGLIAASKLQAAGQDVLVLEKSRALGGRLATRRLQSAGFTTVFDHGAQYFTAKDARFQQLVEDWIAQGVARVWFDKSTENGHSYPTFIGAEGMTRIAKHLAQGITVRKAAKVTRLAMAEPGWQVFLESGGCLQASAIIMTAPTPQAVDILTASALDLPTEQWDALKAVTYDPCVALLMCLDGPVDLPDKAGYWQPEKGSLIGWVAENHQKGISPNGFGLTIQMSPRSSTEWFDQSDEACYECMRQAVQPYLGEAQILDWQVKRWRYALVKNAGTQYYQWFQQTPPLILAGDAFAGPRVEGAVLSGLVAAEQLLKHLNNQPAVGSGTL
ncbi:NAD(P)/FAD-dependent oxidoreductase [Vampirovibrio chlorellavorus]|uniref:NAD(P)/FAD-dependent oxidoreductase n=1 Tax=Vampirovibrio chlorellavorus TaxID=758823 RepID=UPI0026F053AF|nr:FAD-dependent oxidoreductase [Vampirovibrio chlorellavorus]